VKMSTFSGDQIAQVNNPDPFAVPPGRDAEIASALSDLAAHGDSARLPKSIVMKH
jgi:hypothetical protein